MDNRTMGAFWAVGRVFIVGAAYMALTVLQNLQLPAPAFVDVADMIHSTAIQHPSPFTDKFEASAVLQNAVKLFDGAVHGPESVAFDASGDMYMLDRYGNVYRAAHDAVDEDDGDDVVAAWRAAHPERVGYVGPGRPLGFHFDSDGRLVICDSLKGLTRWDPKTQQLEVLSNAVSNGTESYDIAARITYANDLDIARDGTIYFSDSTHIPPALNEDGYYDTLASSVLTLLEGRGTGKLLRYNTATRQTEILMDELWFSNGVALAADESFVLCAETFSLSVRRFWLKGPQAGSSDVLIDGLPGMPDGLVRAQDGTFWVTIVAPVPALAKSRFFPACITRAVAAHLPTWLKPKIQPIAAAVQFDARGTVLRTLTDGEASGRHISSLSSVVTTPTHLFFGSLTNNYIAVLPQYVV